MEEIKIVKDEYDNAKQRLSLYSKEIKDYETEIEHIKAIRDYVVLEMSKISSSKKSVLDLYEMILNKLNFIEPSLFDRVSPLAEENAFDATMEIMNVLNDEIEDRIIQRNIKVAEMNELKNELAEICDNYNMLDKSFSRHR